MCHGSEEQAKQVTTDLHSSPPDLEHGTWNARALGTSVRRL